MGLAAQAESIPGDSGLGLVEQQTCAACHRQFPSPTEGAVAVCPHCQAISDDVASVFAGESHLSMSAVPPAIEAGPSRDLDNPTAVAESQEELPTAESSVAHRDVASPLAVGSRLMPRKESPLAWQLLLTYASLMTLIAMFLGWQLWRRPSRDQLDLPDLAPPVKKDGRVTTLIYVPSGKPLTGGHQLTLGQSRQFGSLEVTAVGVSRGSLNFEYFAPELAQDDLKREPSGEVLKLHLRVKNVSGDQTFVPFDRHLVYTREAERRTAGRFKANNIVWNSTDPSETVLYLYDLSPDSDWIVAGQNLDQELAPGESIEVFLPSTDELPADLPDQLVWRFHFRKGYNRTSFRGVTTVAEVRFGLDQVSNRWPVAFNQSDSPVINFKLLPGTDDLVSRSISSLLP